MFLYIPIAASLYLIWTKVLGHLHITPQGDPQPLKSHAVKLLAHRFCAAVNDRRGLELLITELSSGNFYTLPISALCHPTVWCVGVLCCDGDTTLPGELNKFYTRFDALNNTQVKKAMPPTTDQTISLPAADVRRIFT